MSFVKIKQTALFLILFLSTAQAAEYSVVSSYENKRTQVNSLDTSFISTIEDELAQSGFKVFKDKVTATSPEQTLSVLYKIERTDANTITPTLKAIDFVSGQQIAYLRGYPIQKLGLGTTEIIQQLEGAAISLVRQMIRRLYQQNWANIDGQNLHGN